jgi:hypothetical protein
MIPPSYVCRASSPIIVSRQRGKNKIDIIVTEMNKPMPVASEKSAILTRAACRPFHPRGNRQL